MIDAILDSRYRRTLYGWEPHDAWTPGVVALADRGVRDACDAVEAAHLVTRWWIWFGKRMAQCSQDALKP